jgi:uncharacterized protein
MQLSRRTFLLTTAAYGGPPRKLSALIIDGINNHDWQAGTKFIREVLEASGRFTVEVSTTPPREAPASDWDSWRPNFKSHDVVVSNFNGNHLPDGIRWPQRVEESFEAYLKGGGGFVSYHAANNAFLRWDAYNEIIGLGWRDKTFGPSLFLDENEQVVMIPAGEGLKPGHGPRHDFEMSVKDPRHSITKGLPKTWMHPSEQLTHGQHAKNATVKTELTILTYAWSKDSKQREPMDWVRRWGRGRVYVTMLGHTWKDEPNPNLGDPVFRTLFARGVEWSASGRVTLPSS